MSANAQVLASSERIYSIVPTSTASEVTFRTSDLTRQQEERWQSAIDNLLAWHHDNPTTADDTQARVCIESAIDFACDVRDVCDQMSVPTSVAMTDDGHVSFEWQYGDEIVTIEIVGRGLVELTRFRRGRVVQEAMLKRNPETRRLELRGPDEE